MVAGTTRPKAKSTAWFLNLDADVELAASGRDGETPIYTPTKKVRDAMRPHVATLAKALLSDGDILIDEDSSPDAGAGYVGLAFCPTRRAIAMLERAGAAPAPHPSQSVLRRVNSRAFSTELAVRPLPGSVFATTLEEARAVLASPPPSSIASSWRVKRAFGMAGRGQRVIAPGALDELITTLEGGGVQIEPNVSITRELGLHGMIDQVESSSSGQCVARFGRIVEQTCDARGQWMSTSVASEVTGEIHALLTTTANVVATALIAAGYFGPFGIDAFHYVDRDGATHFQPLSEINARYSMGFPVGMNLSAEHDGSLAR